MKEIHLTWSGMKLKSNAFKAFAGWLTVLLVLVLIATSTLIFILVETLILIQQAVEYMADVW